MEAKAPLNMLKFKMQLKASKNDAFKIFQEELEKMCDEQNKFLESLEYEVAVAEAVDPVQVSSFSNTHFGLPGTFWTSRNTTPYRSAHLHILMHRHCVSLYVYTLICTCITHLHLQEVHNLKINKAAFQGEDTTFDQQIASLQKKMEMIGHHLVGSQSAKKRFEAMLA